MLELFGIGYGIHVDRPSPRIEQRNNDRHFQLGQEPQAAVVSGRVVKCQSIEAEVNVRSFRASNLPSENDWF